MKFIKHLMVMAGLVGLMQTAPALAETTPEQLVKTTADEVLAIVKSDKDIQAGNMSKITTLAEQKVLPNFNFDVISRLVLGKNYSRATPAQQGEFQKQFKDLLVHTYSNALLKYKDQTINYLPSRVQPTDAKAVVKTQVVQSAAQPVEIDYSLEKSTGAWKVYDIVVADVSLITNYRGEFADIIRQKGMDGLNKSLADKNASNGKSKN